MPRSEGLPVIGIERGSPAQRAGLREGDFLLEANGRALRDQLDFYFYTQDEETDIRFRRGDHVKNITLPNSEGEPLGLNLAPLQYRACGNNCVFCFIDQNPPGLRPSLYFKDEDYRLSFLQGNYVTLTLVSDEDLERIVEQHLSPLYVSIHAVQSRVRREMLGLRRDDRLPEKLDFITDNGIEVHGQIVLCPGINDGEVLWSGLEQLSRFHPGLRSLAVVPVGLTAHRYGLPSLNPVTEDTAREILKTGRKHQQRFRKRLGESFLYFADEFYLLAGEELPGTKEYGDFWQTGNGVGLVREFLDLFQEAEREFPERIAPSRRLVLITGTLAEPVLRSRVLPGLNKVRGVEARLAAVENSLFGRTVTVSGLLCGGDILERLKAEEGDYEVLLPSNCLNSEDLFLDDITLEGMRERLGKPVQVIDDFHEIWEKA